MEAEVPEVVALEAEAEAVLDRMFYFLISLLFLFLVSCDTKAIGNRSYEVFKDQSIKFDENMNSDSDDFLIMDNGRIALKKITIPMFKKHTDVSIEASLVSVGDPWDKSAGIFLMQNDPRISSENPIELLRFITPFGVGHFSKDNDRIDEYRPVYIPKWEESISWTENITHLLPILKGEVWIGLWIDTWHKDGYSVSVDLNFIESDIKNHQKENQSLIPLENTTNYFDADISKKHDFSSKDLNMKIELDQSITNAKLYYLTTGHGAHSEGDEFNQRDNIIMLNNEVLTVFDAWRDDCASFRRFNPSSGAWFEKTIWKGEEINERIASSDYSRSNWCPGSKVSPLVIELGDLDKGDHIVTISIPDAQPTTDEYWNFWNVSSYIVYDN